MTRISSYVAWINRIYNILDVPGRSITEMKRQLLALAGQPNFRPAKFKFKVKMVGGMNDRRVRFIFSIPNTWVYPEQMDYIVHQWYGHAYSPEMTTELAYFIGVPDLSWRIREYMAQPPIHTDEYHRIPVSMLFAVESVVGFTRSTSSIPVGGFYPLGEVYYRNPIDFIGLPEGIRDHIHGYLGMDYPDIYHDPSPDWINDPRYVA